MTPDQIERGVNGRRLSKQLKNMYSVMEYSLCA